jgi:uncharacterized protein YjdB
MTWKRSSNACLLVAVATLSLSCGKSAFDPEVRFEVTVTPGSRVLVVGETAQFAAIVTDVNGDVLPGMQVTWSSGDGDVATVSPDGVVRGMTTGSTAITARSDIATGIAQVDVRSAPQSISVASVVMNADVDTLNALGATTQYTATAYDSTGTPVSGAGIGWSSLDTNIATIDGSGIVTAKSVGTVLIVAASTCCAAADTLGLAVRQVVASVAVSPTTLSLPVGSSRLLSAAVVDSLGEPVAGANVAWSSSNGSVAIVDQSGTVTGVSAGAVTIGATSNGKSASAAVTVTTQAPPPPPPQGVLFSDGFETGDFSHTQNGYSWGQVSGSPDSKSVDGAPVLSGDWASRFRQTSACNTGQNRYIQLQANTSAQFLTEFWFEYSIRIPDNYDHSCPGVSTNNKWAEFFNKLDRDATGIFPLTRKNAAEDGGSRLTVAVNSWRGTGEQSATDSWITLADRGSYVRYRYYVRLGTIGQNNGAMKIWKNNTLVFESTSMNISGSQAQYHSIGVWQIMGYDNSGWPAAITWFVDDVALYGSNPGW